MEYIQQWLIMVFFVEILSRAYVIIQVQYLIGHLQYCKCLMLALISTTIGFSSLAELYLGINCSTLLIISLLCALR